MVQINFARREVNCKIVYYGPGLSGKTTNLEVVHKKAPPDRRGELTSIATEGDRTLFFDYMPLDLGKVGGMNTKFQLYTVPGQVYYNATRKLVLQGADGVIFVADSRTSKLQENIESIQNLEDNLKEQGLDIRSTPLVIQWNKRDLPDIMTVPELEESVNKLSVPSMEGCAKTGEGVFPTLKRLAGLVLDNLNKQYGVGTRSSGARSGARRQSSKARSPAAAAGARGAPAGNDRRQPPAGGGQSRGAAVASSPGRNSQSRSQPPPARERASAGADAGGSGRPGRIRRGLPEPQPMQRRRQEAAPQQRSRSGSSSGPRSGPKGSGREPMDVKKVALVVGLAVGLCVVVAIYWQDFAAILGL